MRKIVLIAVVLAASVVLSGCFVTDRISEKAGEKIMEKAIETQTGGKVDVNADKGEMNIKTDQGELNLSQGQGAKLPDNFPSDIFVYDDRDVIMSGTGAMGTGTFNLNYLTPIAVSQAFDKYKTEMEAKGWKKTYEMSLEGGKSNMLNFEKGDSQVSITVGQHEDTGKTYISIVVVKKAQ